MAIRFVCSECGSEYTVPDGHAGKKAQCTQCRKWLRVPVPSTDPAEETPPADPSPAPEPAEPRGPAPPMAAADRTGPVSFLAEPSRAVVTTAGPWFTVGRVLAIAAAALILLATAVPWVWTPADPARLAVARPSMIGPLAVNLLLGALMGLAMLVRAADLRGLAWTGVSSLGILALSYVAWRQGRQMSLWGQEGAGLSTGMYLAGAGYVAAMAAAFSDSMAFDTFRKYGWLGPLLAVGLWVTLVTHVFGTMSHRARITVEVADVTRPAPGAVPFVSATLTLRNDGWEPLALIGRKVGGARHQFDDAPLRLFQQVKQHWKPRETAKLVVSGGDTDKSFLDGGAARIVRVRPGARCELHLAFRPAWGGEATIAGSKSGRWRAEAWTRGGKRPLASVEFDVPGAEHPAGAILRRLTRMYRQERRGDWAAAWADLRHIPAGAPSLSPEQAKRLRASGEQIWPRAARPEIARIREALEEKKADVAFYDEALATVRALLMFREGRLAVAHEDLGRSLRDLEARLGKLRNSSEDEQRVVAQLQQHLEKRRILEAHRALAGLRREHPGSSAIQHYLRRLRPLSRDGIEKLLAGGRFVDAAELISLVSRTEGHGVPTEVLARMARRAAGALVSDPKTRAKALPMAELARTLQPELDQDADFVWENLHAHGGRPPMDRATDFLKKFKDHPKAAWVHLDVAAMLSERLGGEGDPLPAADLAQCLASSLAVVGGPFDAPTRKRAEFLGVVIRLRQALDLEKKPELLPTLARMKSLYAWLRARGAASAPASAPADPSAQRLAVRPAYVRDLLREARGALGWGTSLGEERDVREIETALQLAPATVTNKQSADAALKRSNPPRLYYLRCPSVALTPGQVAEFRKRAMTGASLWLIGTDLGKELGFTQARKLPTSKATFDLQTVSSEEAGREGVKLLEGVLRDLGRTQLPPEAHAIQIRRIREAVPLVQCASRQGRAYILAVAKFGKGKVIFSGFDLGRETPGASRLVFNLKQYLLP